MTKQGLVNDKRTMVLAAVMTLAFWASMFVEPFQTFYELRPLNVVGFLVTFLGYGLWLFAIAAWWRLSAPLAERVLKADLEQDPLESARSGAPAAS